MKIPKNQRMSVIAAWVMLLCITSSIPAFSTTYYYYSGTLEVPGNWFQNNDGTGGAAGNFITPNDVFIIENLESGLIINGGIWTIGSGVTLDLQGTSSNQVGYTGSGGEFILSAGATLKCANTNGINGSTGSFVSHSKLTLTLSTSANYEFSGGTQTSTGLPTIVNNLSFSGSGTKTLTNTTQTISGNLSTSGTAIFPFVGNLNIPGNINIGTGSTLNLDTYNLNLAGNFTNNGTFTAGSGTVSMTSTNAQSISGTTASTFYNLTQNGIGGTTLTSNNIIISNQMTLTNGKVTLGNYDLQAEALSGGSSSSYIKTNSTGRLVLFILSGTEYLYPVGNSSYNPISGGVTLAGGLHDDYYKIRVEDGALSNVNDVTKTVNRKWYVMATKAGVHTVWANVTYNLGETNDALPLTETRKLAYFNGTAWGYADGSETGTGPYIISASGFQTAMTSSDGFMSIGEGAAFDPSKFSFSVSPVDPFFNINSTTATLNAVNSSGTPVYLHDDVTFSLSSNKSLTRIDNMDVTLPLTGLILPAYNYTLVVDHLKFLASTWNTSTNSYSHDAYFTATQTAGTTSLNTTNSSSFDILQGSLYKPGTTSGNWSAMDWLYSSDGGSNWSSVGTKTTFASNDVITVPSGYSIDINTGIEFYSMVVYGSATLASGGTITIQHSTSDYSLTIYGTFTHTGGTITNSNPAFPIVVCGGLFIHNMDGGSLPVMSFTVCDTTNGKCKVTGLSSTALTGGLTQSFMDFIWDNTMSVVQDLADDLTVTGAFTLTDGIIRTGVNALHVTETGSITRSSGYINGKIVQNIPAGTDQTFNFPLGDANGYTPVSVKFNGTVNSGGYFGMQTSRSTPGTGSTIDPDNRINRVWEIENLGVSGYSSFDIDLTYLSDDIVGTVSSPVMSVYKNSQWKIYSSLTSGTYSYSKTALPAFGNFYIGNSLSSSTHNFWLGSSTNWSTNTNWSNGAVPGSATDITIANGISNYPILTEASSCKNVSLESSATLSLGSNTLNVYGDISNNGSLNGNSGTISMEGSVAQVIGGNNSISLSTLTTNNASGVTVNKNLTASTVNNASGKVLNISAGIGLSATSISNSGTLTLKSNAANGSATLVSDQTNLNIQAEQYLSFGYLSPKYYRYWYISSPVSAAAYNVFDTEANGHYYVYAYSETTGLYTRITSGSLTSGSGYVAQVATDRTPVFTGVANTGDYVKTIAYTAANSSLGGWNLVGNPYPAFVNWINLFATRPEGSGINASIIYRGFNGTNSMYYLYYNAQTQESTPAGQNEYIPPMQAFWIFTTSASSITFQNNQKSHQPQTSVNQRLRSPKASLVPKFRLKIERGALKDEILVGFYPGASNSYDSYDTPKLMNDGNMPNLYTIADGKVLAMNSMQTLIEGMEIPIGVNIAEEGEYKLSLSELKNIDLPVFLNDKQSGTSMQINDSDSYTFFSMISQDAMRFSVSLGTKVITDMTKNTVLNFKPYYLNGNICFSANPGQSQIRITDLRGSLILEKALGPYTQKIQLTLSPGVYLAEMIAGNVKTQNKLLIK